MRAAEVIVINYAGQGERGVDKDIEMQIEGL